LLCRFHEKEGTGTLITLFLPAKDRGSNLLEWNCD
jgi:hypothetical protein